MKKARNFNRFTNIALILTLLLGVVPFAAAANFTTVYADDGDETTEPVEAPAEEEAVVEETEDEQETEATEQESVDDAETAEEEIPSEAEEETELEEESVAEESEPAEEVEQSVEETQAVEVVEVAAVEETEDLSEIVEVLSEENVEIVDESGEPLALASQEAAEILASTDPFFWDGTKWIGYTETGTGCPGNVECRVSATPFQQAVTEAGAGNTVYVASGNYAEDVVIDDADMSLIAFHSITVPDAAAPTVTVDSSGFAVVNSITLNADLTLNDGVYADYVIVNQPGETGGRLDDAMTLVNDGGRIEADVVIYGADGHYRVKDKYHPEVNFEWECGEPNEVIYPGRTYRMTLMNPLDQTILDYYTAHGDERNTAPWNLDLTALERMEDLQVAVNVSEETDNWSHHNEERIYWYLVGNTGTKNGGANINLNSTQQAMADDITDGNRDDITRYWGIWFMYPTLENGRTQVNPDNRQLTFLVYDPRPVFGCTDPQAENFDPNADSDDESCVYHEGCMDPEALNYDPEAIYDDESCRYENTIEEPPQFIPDPLPIPVTGENFLIPVTGVDSQEQREIMLQTLVVSISVIVVAGSILFFQKKEEITN